MSVESQSVVEVVQSDVSSVDDTSSTSIPVDVTAEMSPDGAVAPPVEDGFTTPAPQPVSFDNVLCPFIEIDNVCLKNHQAV